MSRPIVSRIDTLAFKDGLRDGAEWDLIGYDYDADEAAADTGWDSATITAMGIERCCKAWGVDPTTKDIQFSTAFIAARRAYEDGVKTALRRRARESRKRVSS